MSEYVCELPFDDVESFGSGNIQIPVRERIMRCKDCRFFWPGVADVAVDWCSYMDGHGTTPNDFCSRAEPIGEASVLADLIDPTCKVSSVETYNDELGQLEGWEFHLTCGHSFQRPWNEPPAYCPECGARVVSDDDQ